MRKLRSSLPIVLLLLQAFNHSLAAYTLSCVSDGDCRSNQPVGSSICDFTSDTIYERKTCSIGACVCRNDYEVTTDGCTPIRQLTVGDRCINEPQERYPFGAFCKTPQNVVTCLENMEFSATSQPPGCRYILPVRSFGDTCNSRVWCDSTLGLECSRVSQKCSCMGDTAIWRDGRCTYERYFGDPCVRDQDCSDPGGVTSVGMICFRSRCVCGPGYIVRVLAVKNPPMITDFDRSNKITYRLMCLNDTISAPAEPGSTCNMIPDSSQALVGASPFNPIRFCWHDSICHRCDGDPSSVGNPILGKCYKLENPPEVPKQLLDVFWAYFTSTTVTPPPTRPTEHSTLPGRPGITPNPPNGKGDWSGKFGEECWTDADCHQASFCLLDLVNSIHPPCHAAICVCRHGNEPDTDGYCKPIRHLVLGDQCKNPIFEILPPGTACDRGIVVCDSPRYVQDPNFDTQCVLDMTILTWAQKCTVGDTTAECDSAAGLDCLPPTSPEERGGILDTATRCWCAIGMWDGTACQVSDFAEVCRVNTDCRGYPLAGVTCYKGLCLCQPGFRPYRTLQLILMQRESLGPGGSMSNALGAATLYRQTVCVNENTTVVSTLNGQCSALIDPRAGSNLCRDGLFCFRCPSASDAGERQTAAVLSSGSCRTLNMLSSAGLDMFGNEEGNVIRGSVNYESGTVGNHCEKDTDCSLYQTCSKPQLSSQPNFYNSSYECHRGYCVCQQGYGLDQNQLCRPLVTLRLGQWCSLAATNTMYPSNGGCHFGKVECNYPFVAKNGTCQLSGATRLRNFKESCMGSLDICKAPLICRTARDSYNMSCECPDASDTFDYASSICRPKLWGEPCLNNSHCDRGGYASMGHAVCNKQIWDIEGFCDCNQKNSYPAQVTKWNTTSQSVTSVTVCLDNVVSSSTRSGILGMCSLRIVQSSGSPPMTLADQGGLCQEGLLCHQCPDDRDKVSTSYGLCRPLQ